MLSCLSEQKDPGRLLEDEGTKEKLLRQCLKLKKKNKEMKVVILSFDARDKEREDRHSSALNQLKVDAENEISTLKAQHFIELSQVRDYRIQEIKDLTLQLHTAQRNLMNQNPLVVTMSDRIHSLERELEQAKQDLIQERAKAELDHRALKSPLNQWMSERQSLLSRVIAAESELRQAQLDYETRNSHLKERIAELEATAVAAAATVVTASAAGSVSAEKRSPIKSPSVTTAATAAASAAVAELSKVQTTLDNLRADLVTCRDEVAYYREENARLEKQVSLMQMDLAMGRSHSEGVAWKEPAASVDAVVRSVADAQTMTTEQSFVVGRVGVLVTSNGVTTGESAASASAFAATAPAMVSLDEQLSGIMSLASPTMNRAVRGSDKSKRSGSAAAAPAVKTSDYDSSKYVSQLGLITSGTKKCSPSSQDKSCSQVTFAASVDPAGYSGVEVIAYKASLDKIKELKAKLAEGETHIAYQRGVIEELVGSKTKVEEGVRDVLADNRALAASLDLQTRECERLRREIKQCKEQLRMLKMSPNDETKGEI